jgi:hypothetical protein
MTLILTALSDNAVIQASDRRLTWDDGSIAKDLAIKAICVSCVDARFSIAFTGLAQIGAKQTDEWLVEYLASINAGCLDFRTLFESLHEHLALTFNKMQHLGFNRRITFALAGFCPVGPFMGILSNVEDGRGNWLREIDDKFQKGFYFRNRKDMQRLDFMINGAESTIRTFEVAIPTFRKRYLNQSPDRIENALVQFIRRANTDQEYGHLVGRNCISTVVAPNGEFQCQDHLEPDSPNHYMPHLIFCNVAYKNIQGWTGDGAPPWWTGDR